MIKLKTCVNGCVLHLSNNESEVFQYDKDNMDGLVDLLYTIVGEIGITGSKYDKQRISIGIKHGRDYECKDKNCPICQDEKTNFRRNTNRYSKSQGAPINY